MSKGENPNYFHIPYPFQTYFCWKNDYTFLVDLLGINGFDLCCVERLVLLVFVMLGGRDFSLLNFLVKRRVDRPEALWSYCIGKLVHKRTGSM